MYSLLHKCYRSRRYPLYYSPLPAPCPPPCQFFAIMVFKGQTSQQNKNKTGAMDAGSEIFPFVNGRCHLQQSMPFATVNVICNSRCHLQQSMPFATVDAICNSQYHLQQSMPFATVDAICNSRCHLQQLMSFETVDAICNSRCHFEQGNNLLWPFSRRRGSRNRGNITNTNSEPNPNPN